MIDTVRFQQPRHHRESTMRRNWDIRAVMREVTDTDGFEDEQLHGYNGVHKKYGIKFFGDRDQIVTVEASLPRVLFGTNGKLIRSQAQIQAAFRKLDRILNRISHPTSRPRRFTRVDLVWHVPGQCADFIAAHEHVRHPRVRKVTCTYQGQSITWGGTALRLVLYDKTRKERGRPGDFVRLEAQLRQHMLDELLEESGQELDFDACYQHLRGLMRQLQPRTTGNVERNTLLLAECSRLSCVENEIHPVEAYLRSLTPRRQRDLRREISAASVERHGIDWSDLLPTEPPPNPPQLDR